MKKIICVVSLLVTLFGYNTSTAFGQINLVKYDSMYIADYLTCAMVDIADMEHDGQQEIVAIYGLQTSTPGNSNYFLKISKVNPNGVSSIDYQLDCGSTITNFIILDANNDNLEDIAYVFSDSVNIVFQSAAGIFDVSNHLTLFSGFSTDGIAKGDFNNDSRDDFVTSNWLDSHLRIFEQSDNIITTGYYLEDVSSIQAGYDQVKVYDVNFDGWQDIVFVAGQSELSGAYVYLNDGVIFATPQYFGLTSATWGNHLNPSNVSFGNFFELGSGLLINSANGDYNDTRFIKFEGGTGNSVNMGLEGFSEYKPSSATADFDNNGKDEVVLLSGNGPEYAHVIEFFGLSSNGSSNFTTISGNYHAYDQLLATGDVVNSDGKTDIVMISDWGQIIIFANAGTTTNISEQNTEANIHIYPNPTTEYINVQINQSGEYTCVISDVSGRIVLQQNNDGQQFTINVSDLNKGMYFLTINGKTSFSKRFIVQ